MIEAPLLLRLQDFESRHDAIFSYIFNVYVAAQKQFFFECSTAMAPVPPAVGADAAPALPLILNHGHRGDIDEVKMAIQRQNQATANTAPVADEAKETQKPVDVQEPAPFVAPPAPAQPAEPIQAEKPIDLLQPEAAPQAPQVQAPQAPQAPATEDPLDSLLAGFAPAAAPQQPVDIAPQQPVDIPVSEPVEEQPVANPPEIDFLSQPVLMSDTMNKPESVM